MRVTTDLVIAEAARQHGVTPEWFLSRRDRSRPLARARQRAMHVVRLLRPDMSMVSIGIAFDDRDHTTVVYGLRAVAKRMESDPAEVERVMHLLTPFAAMSALEAVACEAVEAIQADAVEAIRAIRADAQARIAKALAGEARP